MNEKHDIKTQCKSSPFLRTISWAFLLLLILLPIRYYTIYYLSYFTPPSTAISPYLSIETITLNQTQQDEIKQLGLTPKPQIKIITNGKGEQIIHGRFLHITDIHPDPYYIPGSSTDKLCHGGKGTAGKYGDAILGCDAPMILMNDTIKWISDHLKDKIDFIIWTGDNMRHDNDRNYPRSEQQIFDMNQQVSDLMYDAFRHSDEPVLETGVIPSLGNNDVFPHNLFSPGPTLQTRELYRIWQKFIPPVQMHTFGRGAYFFQEVIPNQLAVLSINTLYLFQSNPLVDNCDKRKQPGYKLFEWLGVVLKEMRARNMKVWLSGHVPPNEKNFDVSCLRKYIVWTHEYRDVIIGGVYGHMNIDHFIPLDSVAAWKSIKKSLQTDVKSFDEIDSLFIESDSDSDDEDDITHPLEDLNIYRVLDERFDEDFFRVQGGIPANKVAYMETLREELYATIKGKKKSGNLSERYSVAHVAASVIPTFNPGIRVWEYNITNLADQLSAVRFEPWDKFFLGVEEMMNSFDKYDIEPEEPESISYNADESVFSILAKKRDKTFPLPKPADLPVGPGFTNQTFTPERYVQYYLDLENINAGKKKFGYEIEYATDDSLYGLNSLIVDEWIKFGRKLGKPVKEVNKKSDMEELQKKGKKKNGKKNGKDNKDDGEDSRKLQAVWDEYLKNAFISSDYEHKGFG
ncbi:PPN1 [[Candida] subhashii]|uniref:Endopolyphosphatase n=1 Tax=[Candida] subhashii TaxID=561895 RepID=A0A8J5QI17_9ASCO|nr:PPN1 [[Candida] subhashii]KAG7665016.1 PPN1 [[Candida] subhashii]